MVRLPPSSSRPDLAAPGTTVHLRVQYTCWTAPTIFPPTPTSTTNTRSMPWPLRQVTEWSSPTLWPVRWEVMSSVWPSTACLRESRKSPRCRANTSMMWARRSSARPPRSVRRHCPEPQRLRPVRPDGVIDVRFPPTASCEPFLRQDHPERQRYTPCPAGAGLPAQ